MDPITHTMAGAAMSRAGGDRLTPLATATLILAANAPDIDIYTVWTETSFGSIAFRRGWTHGPYFLTLLPLLITGIIVAWDRFLRRRRRPDATPVHAGWTFVLALIGTLSHPALDWLNTYGVRFLMPFSSTWFAGDSVFIIDPYWWLLLAAVLVLAKKGASLRTVRLAALAAAAYPLALVALSRAGDEQAISAAERAGIAGLTDVMYQPSPANPFAAQLIGVTEDAYHMGSLRWIGGERVRWGDTVIAKGDWTSPLVRRAMQDADARDYLVWARYAWARIDTTATGEPVAVVFGDARFPEGGIAGGLGGLRVPITRE
jgi:inner membrane protein